jgi:ubiquinone/menaquinone biosynthesis C-methylase UbiE
MLNNDQVRTEVRNAYAKVAKGQDGCSVGCCGSSRGASKRLGYTDEDLDAVPEGADLGLGCGNPQLIAALQEGETVLDLGSGAGFDCLLASKRVGPRGRVIGVDMTPEMVVKARDNVLTVGASNVDIRLGEIEHLPVADASVDVIMSNCVINLSPDKAAVFKEAFRVLKVGGRFAISDVITVRPMPPELAESIQSLTGCVAGSVDEKTLRTLMKDAGFSDIRVDPIPHSREVLAQCMPGAEDYVLSATIEGTKRH